ncbi:MAG: hypothetical protein RL414_450 [Actinomycetota bacterium]|jgi:hypothetical protein
MNHYQKTAVTLERKQEEMKHFNNGSENGSHKSGGNPFRKRIYTFEERQEMAELKRKLKSYFREAFTLKKMINPGWKQWTLRLGIFAVINYRHFADRARHHVANERGDVPGWVLVVLMTTGLVTAIWTLAAPRIQSILRTSLDSMNNIR